MGTARALWHNLPFILRKDPMRRAPAAMTAAAASVVFINSLASGATATPTRFLFTPLLSPSTDPDSAENLKIELEDAKTPCSEARGGRFDVLDGRASVSTQCKFAAARGPTRARALARVLHGKARGPARDVLQAEGKFDGTHPLSFLVSFGFIASFRLLEWSL